MMAATPCPPPMHIVRSEYLPPVLRSSYRALTVRMASMMRSPSPRRRASSIAQASDVWDYGDLSMPTTIRPSSDPIP